MPSPPQLRHGGGKKRSFEVGDDLYPHTSCGTNGNQGVASQVGIDLKRVEQRGKGQGRAVVVVDVVEYSVDIDA